MPGLQDIGLPLPSAFPDYRNALLQDIEHQLRESLAFDCLRDLRKGLAERIALQREKDRYIRGQADNFRSQAAIKRVQAEIGFVATRYRTTYTALAMLGGNINPELMQLRPEDISAANIFEYTRQLGRGGNTDISWIWRQTAVGAQAQDDDWLEEVLRTQFLEAKINHDRWAEECEIAKAELTLTRETFEYQKRYWTTRALGAPTEAAAAHAQYMAAMYNGMGTQITRKINLID